MTEVIKGLSQSLKDRVGISHVSISMEHVSIFLLWLFTVSSIVGIGLGYLDWFISKTPLNLMLGFLLVLINIPFGNRYGKIVFVTAFLFGMLLEIVGVIRGDIFGSYYYGENLGFKVMGVPLMIGIYWAVLTTITSQMARKISNNLFVVVIIGASLMVGLDFIMEQMAHDFDYWHFVGDIAPFQNYVAWFIAAFLLHILAFKFIPKGGSRFSLHLYLNQVAFFVVALIILRLW